MEIQLSLNLKTAPFTMTEIHVGMSRYLFLELKIVKHTKASFEQDTCS
jgi:hypothetical protein